MSNYAAPVAPSAPPDRWAAFERSRPRLFRIAARMLGSADDAEDMVQETSLRWLQADTAIVRAPEAWLVTVIRRLAVNRLREAAREQRAYGEVRHLEAAVLSDGVPPEHPQERALRASTAFRMLRACLEPAERVALVLREAFAAEYDDIARVLDKSQAACRQIVHRARARLRRGEPRFVLRGDVGRQLADRFIAALAAGDRATVLAVLTEGAAAGSRRRPRSVQAPVRRRDGALCWHRSSAPRAGRRAWASGVALESPAA